MLNNNINNKRIAKNTVLLYIRMFITILISLYTSRVILQTLGVEDYGIYGLVGGVVIMLTFINSSMSGATSRFITFALGENNKQKLLVIFNTAFYIHLFIALLIFLIAETAGLWFVYNKLIIPENRLFAALCIFHLFVISTVATVIQTPFNALIIAYEKMDIYAYIEMVSSILKLIIVFILQILPYDKLITYGFLFLFVNISIMFSYAVYSYKHFEICRIRILNDKSHLKPILKYSMWDLFGSLSGTLKQQGTNIIINLFFGVFLNAASSIATQVQAAVSGLAANVIQAFRPQIIKSYSKGDIPMMEEYVCNAIKYTLLLYGMCIIPLYVKLDFILNIWLGIVPEHALAFCRLLLINSYIGLIVMILITTNHATGKIQYLSTATGVNNILILPITYIAYKMFSAPAETTYIISICFSVITFIADIIITKFLIPSIQVSKILHNILIPISISLLGVILILPLNYYISNTYIQFILMVIISVIWHLMITYSFVITNETRLLINKKLKSQFKCIKH